MSLFLPDRLLGRSAEESILLNSYFASLSMGEDRPAAVILIHGDSGLGKTKLAETLRPHVLEDDGYFLRGKFDQLSYGSANRPYQGIATALAEYCAAVEQRSQETWCELVGKLQREITGDEGDVLFEVLPSLRKIIGGPHRHEEVVTKRRHSCDACQHIEEEKVQESPDNFSESGSHRLFYVIKRFVSVISSLGDPIVLLFDDIQWANKADLDVLKAIFSGASNPFMFIFTCRPMEPNHPFLRISDNFEGKTEIMLQCLRRNSVRELVAEMLRVPESECTSLANFISRVTNGNPFFVRQQIISLRDEGLLRVGADGWYWKINEIEEIHDTSGNVVVMLSERMKRLPSLTQHALKICSCIGSKIDLYLLGLLLRKIGMKSESFNGHEEKLYEEGDANPDDEDNESLANIAIEMAVQEGLVVITRNGKGLAFTHDSVNEAAYSLLEPDKRATYHLKLGKTMHENVCPTLRQKYLFTIAAQLTRGNELVGKWGDEEDRITMAHIYLSAGEKSMAASAFPGAHFFFSKGMELLREDDWRKNYRLCCDIYMKTADTAALTADFRGSAISMESCLAVLFDRCKGSLVDFLNASYIRVRSLIARDDPSALDIGLDALRVAGIKFPNPSKVSVVAGLAKTRTSMKKISVAKLLELPPITDKTTYSTMNMMGLCINISLSYGQKLLPLICIRMIQWNLTHGISKWMPPAMALYGAMLSRLGYPLSEAEKYGEIALKLQDKLGSKETRCHVAVLTWGTNFTRIKKLSDCLKPVRAGYDAGMKVGDITHMMSCASSIALISFYSGQKLSKVALTLEQLRASLSEANMVKAIRVNRIYRQAVDFCLGNSGPSRFSLPTDDNGIGCKKTNVMINEQTKLVQLVVGCIFCDYELAWEISEKLDNFARSFAGSIWPYICTFYVGMSAASLYQASRERQAIGTARACLKSVRKGQKRSETNLSHLLYLLEAEVAVIRKKYTSAEKFYSLAIEHAARAGVTHEHAYACERFGTYHLLRNNHDEAYKHIREAHRLYLKWGSRPKCEQLKKKYPKLEENRNREKQLFAPISV